MRVLILGGTGFIGSYVVRYLAAKGHELTVVHRGRSSNEFPEGVNSLVFDRQHLSEFAGQIKKGAPDVVVDMIPRTAQEAWGLTRVVAGIAGRIITVSSIDVYRAYNRLRRTEQGAPDPVPLKENGPLRELLYPYRGSAVDALHTAYEYEKILVEKMALSEPDLPTTILRLPVVYGPKDPQRRIYDYLKRMDDRRPAILLGKLQSKWRVTRGYVEDVANAVVVAAEDTSPGNRIYNVGEQDPLPEEEWVRLLASVAGWKGEIVTVEDEALPPHLSQGYDWRQHLTIDTEALRADLGWQDSTPREKALDLTIAWQRENPPEADLEKFDYAAEDEVLGTQARLASSRGR